VKVSWISILEVLTKPRPMSPRVSLLALSGFLFPIGAFGQDVQPRVYTPAPVGVNLVTVAYSYSSGLVLFDKTIPIENANGDIHGVNLAYSRSIGVFGMAGRADILAPFVNGDWEGDLKSEARTVSRTGFGDPTIRVALFFVGAPALTREEFASFEPKTIIGGIVRVRVPLGQYEADKLINLGSNRWSVSPQLGVSHVAGRFLLEAYAAAWFFSNNNEFLGTNTLAQDPLLTFQVHAGYLFRGGFWLAVSSRQSLGGMTSVGGAAETAPETSNRVGATLAIPIAHKYVLKFIATTGLTATIGNDYDTFGVAFQVVL